MKIYWVILYWDNEASIENSRFFKKEKDALEYIQSKKGTIWIKKWTIIDERDDWTILFISENWVKKYYTIKKIGLS